MIRLPDRPRLAATWRRRLERLFEATRSRPPADLAAAVRAELGIDLAARYGGVAIPHPFGKASGQLSCTVRQVQADVAAGVAFIVLKTVIAEGARGERSMEAWTVPETRMQVEPLASAAGRAGWTVTWKGRGWPGTLEEYADFFAGALAQSRRRDVPVVPSITYHLPAPGETWRREEYAHTTCRLLEVWDGAGCGGPMILEKDFSPTLAGDARAADPDWVLDWLRMVPRLMQQGGAGRLRLGVKVMNAVFDDAFQAAMVRTLVAADPAPDFLVVFNRLYDVRREVAYGGYDLSDRNLRVLDRLRTQARSFGWPGLPPLSATGNICSGRMMLEYALRGCENGQLHTFFQLPLSEYPATGGSRSARALHALMLHPGDGLAVWLRHLHEAGQLDRRDDALRFLDVVDRAAALA